MLKENERGDAYLGGRSMAGDGKSPDGMNELATLQQNCAANGNALAKAAASVPAAQNPPAEFTAKQRETAARLLRKATFLRNMEFPLAAAKSLPLAKELGAAALKVVQDQLLQSAGGSTDPVESMLLQQLNLAHHRVAQLHAQAAEAKDIEAAKVYSTAAARLTGEVRRLALAVKQYREPSSKRLFQLIKQLNVTAGSQQVAYVEQCGQSSGIPFNNVGSEQGSKRIEYAAQTPLISESQAAGSRPPEPSPARPADASGTGAVTASGPQAQTVAAVDGAPDAGRQGPLRRQRSLAARR
jgi:hypothetical protein